MSRMIRKPEVLKLTGLKKSQLDVAIKDGRFPKSFEILEGGRAQGWFEDEIVNYVESRRQARDAAAAAPKVVKHKTAAAPQAKASAKRGAR
jgi:prophage regulatory protein